MGSTDNHYHGHSTDYLYHHHSTGDDYHGHSTAIHPSIVTALTITTMATELTTSTITIALTITTMVTALTTSTITTALQYILRNKRGCHHDGRKHCVLKKEGERLGGDPSYSNTTSN